MRVLFLRPYWKDDVPTAYMAYWLGELVPRAEGLGHEVVDIEGYRATRDNVLNTLAQFNPDVIIAEGHGERDVLTGYMTAPLLTASDVVAQPSIAFGRSIHAQSCFTASVLGAKSKEAGARMYAGYMSSFDFIVKTLDPSNDPVAEFFKEPVQATALSMLNEDTPRGVYNATMRAYSRSWGRMFSSFLPEIPFVGTALEHDRSKFVVLSEEPAGPSLNLIVSGLALSGALIGALGLARFTRG